MVTKTLGTLEPVEINWFWTHEAYEFTPWLAEEANLALLSGTLGLELEFEGMEVAVGPYKADIVARDLASDTKVIIENQLEKTNHDHLGKTITYASGLDAKIIIWIAKEFTEEHRRALDYLNDNAAPNLRLFGIEMKLWRIGNSPPAPLFKVIASPNDYVENIKVTNEGLSRAEHLYLGFWTAFKDYCLSKGTPLKIPKPLAQNWMWIAVGKGNFGVVVTAAIQKKRLGCEIYLDGSNAKNAFKQLKKQKDEIQLVTGHLDWQELPGKQACRIARYQYDIDITDKATWDSAHQWLKSEAELFHKSFAPRIKNLSLSVALESEYGGEYNNTGEG